MEQTFPKSGPSLQEAIVSIVNRTERTVEIYWLDYNGNPRFYKQLLQNRHFRAQTFVGHAWIAVDKTTNERLLIGRQLVFFPCAAFKHHVVVVSLPLFSLRSLCLRVVGNHMQDKESVDELELPATLKQDIINLLSDRLYIFSKLYNKHRPKET